MAVLVYLKTAIALDEDVILSIHRHHWHLAQHVHHGLRLRLLIGLHVVGDTVYFLLDELLLRFNHYAVQFLVPGDGIVLDTG